VNETQVIEHRVIGVAATAGAGDRAPVRATWRALPVLAAPGTERESPARRGPFNPARSAQQSGTCKLNGVNSEAYLHYVPARINDHKINHLQELLPWNVAPLSANDAKKAA
jgi:hypothetical protein